MRIKTKTNVILFKGNHVEDKKGEIVNGIIAKEPEIYMGKSMKVTYYHLNPDGNLELCEYVTDEVEDILIDIVV